MGTGTSCHDGRSVPEIFSAIHKVLFSFQVNTTLRTPESSQNSCFHWCGYVLPGSQKLHFLMCRFLSMKHTFTLRKHHSKTHIFTVYIFGSGNRERMAFLKGSVLMSTSVQWTCSLCHVVDTKHTCNVLVLCPQKIKSTCAGISVKF